MAPNAACPLWVSMAAVAVPARSAGISWPPPFRSCCADAAAKGAAAIEAAVKMYSIVTSSWLGADPCARMAAADMIPIMSDLLDHLEALPFERIERAAGDRLFRRGDGIMF